MFYKIIVYNILCIASAHVHVSHQRGHGHGHGGILSLLFGSCNGTHNLLKIVYVIAKDIPHDVKILLKCCNNLGYQACFCAV